jgi:CRP/FNR family transcriptional regulator, cyclic AMP receptor protein
MVSPELLRRYPFFGALTDKQLSALAMLTEEVKFAKGADIVEEGQPSGGLLLLTEGSIDLYSISQDKHEPKLRKEFLVGEVNPGEPLGVSALVEPFVVIATARAAEDSKALRVDASGVRALCAVDAELAAALYQQVAKAALGRLAATQAQLAAARA